MANISKYSSWQRFFLTGKTKSVYFSFLSFAFFVVLIVFSRSSLLFFIVSEIGGFAGFGVIVDFISHMFNDKWTSTINRTEWKIKFKTGRTHDAYGILVEVGCILIEIVRFPLASIALFFLIMQLYFVVKLKFYH
jgi:hypothetical protein